MQDRRFKNIVEYVLLMSLVSLVRALPRQQALKLGGHLGRLAQHVLPKRRRRAVENLSRAFPEMSSEELGKNCEAIFRHLGISGVEMLLMDKLDGQRDLERYFDFEGLEHIRGAFTLGKGVLILSGHLGFWEVGTFFLPQLGLPSDFVAKNMKNPYINRFFIRTREAAGGKVLDTRKGARRILRSLAENRGVCVLLDQHTSPKQAVSVDFFGRPAWTTPIIAQMAMKQGTPIVPAFCRRTDDLRYKVEFQPMILLENDPNPEAVKANTALFTNIIEEAVRKDITQWFWVHRRWRD